MLDQWNPKDAIDGRYLWLPIQFAGDGLTVEWENEWDLSRFSPETP